MWNPFEQITNVFNKEELVRVSKDIVVPLLIPERSKEFLTTIGFPKESILLCEFDIESFPTIEEYAHQQEIKIECGQSFKRIGTDSYLQICLSEEGAKGEVWGYGLKEKLPVRFINSDIETFVAFLALYIEDYCKFNDQPDEILDENANRLDKKLRRNDPKAFEDKESWWPLVTKQIKEGLL